MSPTLTTLLNEAANFLLLAGALGWLFFRPVRQALSEHRSKLDAVAKAAEEKMAAAEEIRLAAESRQNALRDELAKLRTETLESARQEAATIIAQAKDQAARVTQAAEQHGVHLEEAQAATLSHAVAAAASRLVDH